MAAELFGDRSCRNDAEPVTHATTYGMGPRGLAAMSGIGEAEARALLRKLCSRFPQLARFKNTVRTEAERRHILYNAFGRPIRIDMSREYTQAPAAIGPGRGQNEALRSTCGWALHTALSLCGCVSEWRATRAR